MDNLNLEIMQPQLNMNDDIDEEGDVDGRQIRNHLVATLRIARN